MAKFHIGKDGKPSKCTAIKGKCPFGDESHHYNTMKEAKKSLEEKLSIEKNVFSSSKKEEKEEKEISENFGLQESMPQQESMAQAIQNLWADLKKQTSTSTERC